MRRMSSRGFFLVTTMLGTAALAGFGGPASAADGDQAPIATAAQAQTPAPAPAPSTSVSQTSPAPAANQGTTVQEIVVTGTMFRRTSKESDSPVTTLTQTQLQRAGITTISDAVRSVSADNSGSIPTAFGNGFAVGSSGVALRGLTVNSTLVLIDGLRTTNYPLADDGERGFVDLNTIPESLIDRVEVLKDGASSLYGADAIGGVVNIILKPQFQGFEASGDVGTSQGGGGTTRRLTFTAGKGDLNVDGWNFYVNGEYQADSAIGVGQRGFPYNTTDLSSIGGNNLIGGQPGLNSGSIYGSVTPGYLSTPGNVTTGVALPGAVSQPLRACGPGSKQSTDANGNVYCAQDLARYGDDQPEQERWGLYGRLTKQFDKDTRAYFSLSYNQNQVHVDGLPNQIQYGTPNNTNNIALPACLNGTVYGVNCAYNPNDPFAKQGEAALLNYAFGDIPAFTEETNHVIRAVAGIKGVAAGWNYEAEAVIAHAWLNTTMGGYINYNQLISDINTGAYNFINPSQNSQAVLNALSPDLNKVSTTNMDSLDVRATRSLFDLPGGPLNLGLGGQFRYESTYDPNLNPGAAYQGLGLAQTIGSHTVDSAYFEIDAPVIKKLDINVSGRLDHYSDFGTAFSPKAGFKWTPIRQLAFRGTWSRGFRAPSFSENGSSSAEGFITYTPPCTFQVQHGATPTSNGGCTGGDGYVQPYQMAVLTAANPNIKPETSDSFTGGVVWEPKRWFSISADYYNITKHNVIEPANYTAALNAYFAGQPLPPGFTITADNPDPNAPGAQARPVVVAAPYVNASSLKTDGLDIDARFRFKLPADILLTSDIGGTEIFSYKVTQPDGSSQDYVGLQSPYVLSSGAGTPKYRASWQTSLSRGPATITGTLYYTSGLQEYGVDAAPYGTCMYSNAAGSPFPNGCKTKGFTDFDLTGSYQINEHVQVFANIMNLFNSLPPLDPADYAGVNYNPTYAQSGIVGRFFKVGFNVKY